MTKQKYLTAAEVKAAKTDPKGRQEIPAGVVPGLYLIIQPTGSKVWAFRYRHRGRTRKMTLGRYPYLSLSDARKVASEALAQVERLIDPAEVRKEKKKGAGTFEKISLEFIELHCVPRTKSAKAVERILRKEIFPYWRTRQFDEIRRHHILDLIDRMMASNRPVLTNRTLSLIKSLFNWAVVDRGIIEVSPAVGIRPPAKEISRDRVLNDNELQRFWNATATLGFPWQPFYQLLVLTAQRRRETASMRWDDLDLEAGLWTLPAEATKPGRVHDVPLSHAAAELLQSAPRFSGPFVFSFNGGESPITGFSKAKILLDSQLTVEVPWTVHDLRRSAATWMAGHGVPIHVLAAILNHSPGSTQGVTSIYNRFRYVEERRVALEAWSTHLLPLNDVGTKVVSL